MSNKFKVGDLVRPITASSKSRAWEVVGIIDEEESTKYINALTGKSLEKAALSYQCQSFAYNKIQIKFFRADELKIVSVNPNTKV